MAPTARVTRYQPREREAALLALIARLRAATGRTPRQTELADSLGVCQATISFDLRTLRAGGYIDRDDRPRHIALTSLGRKYVADHQPKSKAARPQPGKTALLAVNTKATEAGEAW